MPYSRVLLILLPLLVSGLLLGAPTPAIGYAAPSQVLQAATPASLLVASPMLSIQCGFPNQRDIVFCRLSDRGFRPVDRLLTVHLPLDR